MSRAEGTIHVCPPVAGGMYAPETIVALRALGDAARRQVKREKASAGRHAEHRRKKLRKHKALVRHIKRSRA